MPLAHFFISKNRKVNFEISILIRDLKNVPLVSGLYHIRWRMKHASHTNGSTQRAPIKDHSIYWNHPISTMVQLVIDKHHVLSPCEFKLEIYQEIGSGKDAEMIGSLTVNLAEYATTGLTTRRYLLEQCKFNSTLKLSIQMTQKSDVDTEFVAPPLRKQQIFTDIPTMINKDEKQRSMVFYENKIARPSRPPPPTLKKSHSAMSLPRFCRQTEFQNDTEEQSPTDLVEQLFMGKQPDINAFS
ncbi:N-terminal C2 in EEIG1 and EHBP1 proteins-domain-containing protein [Phycomyces blakesleeanus]|uniref:C2 NT-type domain-containing protein n=2 Tax=Phycomyces blakesleeanus TaxID=4837 RepID=A0A167Q6J3_PHYB8|nr:hypothetical protein PHYBLDRAFT_162236 [Phycomyces blakesleeanus NRRL 1555(-)]OAD79158.1 hypothetical protein PHYBLDRAFT_162236 [Phycomyces blakesleeanus NRRL 1555(-)]|eukprot:XP_018297198.1 hypothetical protein PHYBLDRAFT_162236 [Phycomyces blakesleeanus NRRL 1555(-)]